MKNFSCINIEEDGQVICSVWQKGSEESKSVSKYIKASEQKMSSINKIIDGLGELVIVWGAGALTQRLLETTQLSKKTIIIVDRNPKLIGKNFNGIKIIAPDELFEYSNPILISSFKFKDEIIKYIKSQNYKNKLYTF